MDYEDETRDLPYSSNFAPLSTDAEGTKLKTAEIRDIHSENNTSKSMRFEGPIIVGNRASVEDRTKAISRLIEICGSNNNPVSDGVIPGTQPLRIIFIGKPGAGKSSFINGIIAALSETEWSEHAHTGDCSKGVPISILTERFEKCCNGHRDKFKNVSLPTLIDVAGLLDDKDQQKVELLRLMFYGYLKHDESVMKVYEDIRDKTIDEIRLKYRTVYKDMRVDRVVFVASAADPLPDKLMACVLEAARPSNSDLKRTVPVFGVLTKMDKVDPTSSSFEDKVDPTSSSFEDKEKKFIKGLGLIKPRLLTCKNYCDDVDPKGRRTEELNPELDVPYIQFMQKLCNRAQKVRVEGENLPVPEPEVTPEAKPQNAENAGIISACVTMGVLLLFFLYIWFFRESAAWSQFWEMIAAVVLALVIGALSFVYLP